MAHGFIIKRGSNATQRHENVRHQGLSLRGIRLNVLSRISTSATEVLRNPGSGQANDVIGNKGQAKLLMKLCEYSICVSIYLHTHAQICVNINIYAYICVYVHIYTYICVYI